MASVVDDLVASSLVARNRGPEVAFDSWKDVVQRSLLRFRFDCEQPRAFKGAVTKRTLADVSFIDMECDKHAAYRDQSTISAADTGYYLMTLQISGEFRMSQDDRTAALKPGLFALYDSSKPATLISGDDYKSICLRFPKKYIGSRAEESLAGITATAFECGVGLSSAVWAMVLSMSRTLDSLGNNGHLAVRNMMELVTTMLRTELAQQSLDGDERRELLLQRIREYIDTRLSDPGLDPNGIAAAHYISPRYLHSLFEGTNFTVAAWMRARRIELCQRDLADPQMINVPAAAIAARWGFKGPSHFGQVFKRETGQTPTDFRRTAMARFREQ
ncbi:MAG: helix-turn-helix domain-containing protein [Pseudonocardiaceae bacterium]|nr:helix-turn-helix domain-containing protein [Pseudonocardiaceae bacterium]